MDSIDGTDTSAVIFRTIVSCRAFVSRRMFIENSEKKKLYFTEANDHNCK